MITMHPHIYVAVIVPLLAIGSVTILLLIGEIIREWKVCKRRKEEENEHK